MSAVRDPITWLSEIDSTLMSCATRGEVMARMPEALTSEFADWCALYVVVDPGAERQPLDHESAQRNGDLSPEFREPFDDPGKAPELEKVLRTGRANLIEHLDTESAARLGLRRDAHAERSGLGIHTSLLVPIADGDSTIGALHLLRADLSEPFTDHDREVVEHLGARIATKLSLLEDHDDDRALMISYQRALLPNDLPEVPGADIAARYWAVGPNDQVGGDFYDVFALGSDRWVAVIGDIVGHGMGAAAYTALARHSIRMSAWHGDPPEEILHWLDRALKADDDHSCTAAVNVLERLDGGGFELTTALGGHPRPIVCRSDGSVEAFGTWGTVLGTLDDPRSVPMRTRLDSGSVLLLYTDGITDRPLHAALTEKQFCDLVRSSWPRSSTADELLQRILTDIELPLDDENPDDDVALLAFRVL